MKSSSDWVWYVVGAVVVVMGVGAWLWWTAPTSDLLAEQYRFGIL